MFISIWGTSTPGTLNLHVAVSDGRKDENGEVQSLVDAHVVGPASCRTWGDAELIDQALDAIMMAWQDGELEPRARESGQGMIDFG